MAAFPYLTHTEMNRFINREAGDADRCVAWSSLTYIFDLIQTHA